LESTTTYHFIHLHCLSTVKLEVFTKENIFLFALVEGLDVNFLAKKKEEKKKQKISHRLCFFSSAILYAWGREEEGAGHPPLGVYCALAL
jgi:hypothetical protein